MKRLLLTCFLLIGFTSIFASPRLDSYISSNIFYHPTINLSEESELPIRSSIGNRIVVSPIAFSINNIELSLDTGIMFVSDSLVYNNTRQRGYSALDLNLGTKFIINDYFRTKLTVGAGILQLGNEDLVEAYLISSITPNFLIYKNHHLQITIDTPMNVIYRKQLLTITAGVGISIGLKWNENFIKD